MSIDVDTTHRSSPSTRNGFCRSCGAVIGPPVGPPCPHCGSHREPACGDYDDWIGATVHYRLGDEDGGGIVVAATPEALMVGRPKTTRAWVPP